MRIIQGKTESRPFVRVELTNNNLEILRAGATVTKVDGELRVVVIAEEAWNMEEENRQVVEEAEEPRSSLWTRKEQSPVVQIQEIPICHCTNDMLERGETCGASNCPNRGL